MSDDLTIERVAEVIGRNANTIRRHIRLILENVELTKEQYLNLLDSGSSIVRDIARRKLYELYGLKVRDNNIYIEVVDGEEKD